MVINKVFANKVELERKMNDKNSFRK